MNDLEQKLKNLVTKYGVTTEEFLKFNPDITMQIEDRDVSDWLGILSQKRLLEKYNGNSDRVNL